MRNRDIRPRRAVPQFQTAKKGFQPFVNVNEQSFWQAVCRRSRYTLPETPPALKTNRCQHMQSTNKHLSFRHKRDSKTSLLNSPTHTYEHRVIGEYIRCRVDFSWSLISEWVGSMLSRFWVIGEHIRCRIRIERPVSWACSIPIGLG